MLTATDRDRPLDRLGAWLAAPAVDARLVAVARIGFGVGALLKLTVLAPVLFELAGGEVLQVPLVEGLPGPSPAIATAIVLVWALGATALTLGWHGRLAAGALAAAMVTTLGIDGQLYSNHLYLMTMLAVVLALSDTTSAWSLDARDRPTGPRMVATWGPFVIRSLVSIVYLYAALHKLAPDYLDGWVLDAHLHDGLVPYPDELRTVGLLRLMALGSIVTELVLAIGIWHPRLTRWAVGSGIVLHLPIIALLPPTRDLIVFAVVMGSTYPLAFSPTLQILGSRADASPDPATHREPSEPWTLQSSRP